jgi:hypothetical protein
MPEKLPNGLTKLEHITLEIYKIDLAARKGIEHISIGENEHTLDWCLTFAEQFIKWTEGTETPVENDPDDL